MFNQIWSVVCVILKIAAFILGEFGVFAWFAYIDEPKSDRSAEDGARKEV